MASQAGITVTGLSAVPSPAVKPVTSSPGSSAASTSSTTVIQNMAGQNIIKQVRGRERKGIGLHDLIISCLLCRCEHLGVV